MTDQPQQTPLIELARSVPKDLRAEWETQWFEDGTPCGHAMAPVGKYLHDMADEIERLTAEYNTLKADYDECYQELIDTDLGSQKFQAKVEQLEFRLECEATLARNTITGLRNKVDGAIDALRNHGLTNTAQFKDLKAALKGDT